MTLHKITFILACLALLIALTRQPPTPLVAAQLSGTSITTGTGAPGNNCGVSNAYTPGSIYIQANNGHIWTCSSTTWTDDTALSTSVPSGFTGMIMSGSCPSGYSEVSALDAGMPYGTLAAHGDVGGTGGANTITPTVATLTAAAQTFTGSSATTSATSAGTPAGTNGAPTIAWPAGVPTFAGSALGTHTHTVTPTGTNAATTTSGNTAATNIAAGTGSLTAAKATAPNITVPAEVFTGASDTTSAVSAGTPTGTVAWPAGVPTQSSATFSGSPLGTHTHTLTATGTNGSSSVTGTINSFDNRPAYVKVIFCKKT